MKIVADKNIPFLKGIAEDFGDTTYLAGSDFTHEAIRTADALIVRTVTRFDENLLRDTSVKLICTATIGFDHIDTQYCDAHNIAWTNAPGCNSGSVQQYIISSLITLSRQRGFDLKEKTIGIVGVGNVGKKVAKACCLLGMNVLLNDPPRQITENSSEFTSLDTIVQEADIITFHTPLTKEGEYKTFHLADKEFFCSLKKKPIIINSARGAIVDTLAIKEALKKGQISGAVVDCWEKEPDIDLEYMSLVDIATPHIAGYSADGKANATRMSLEAIARFFSLDAAPAKRVQPPLPQNPIINMDKYGSTDRLYGALLDTYNPIHDFDYLKAVPTDFKKLRNEYPLRREALAYTIVNATQDERKILSEFGFNVLEE